MIPKIPKRYFLCRRCGEVLDNDRARVHPTLVSISCRCGGINILEKSDYKVLIDYIELGRKEVLRLMEEQTQP